MKEKAIVCDIDAIDELEYSGYRITRVEPQYYFYIISAAEGSQPIATALQGKWTSPKEAIAAIDATEHE